jgi:6-phosphogluconolactonase (cycloisomerase 2 family)
MRRAAAVLAVACAVLLTGCASILLISAPESVSIGDVATFVLRLGVDFSGAGNANVYVAAEVPIGWDLDSATYSATINGAQVSGTGAVTSVPPNLAYCPLDARDGYQVVWVTDGTYDVSPGDVADVTLDFAVNDLPAGEIEARFWVLVDSDTGSHCPNYPAVATINRSPRRLTFRETVYQGALNKNHSLAVSPDRSKLLVGGGDYTEASLYDRSPVTGELVWVESFDKATIFNLQDIVFSPDGRHVYGVDEGQDHVVAFEFGVSPGALTPIQEIGTIAGDFPALTISSDGSSVYVTVELFDSVVHCSRDPVSGELTIVDSHQNSAAGQDDPRSPEVSPDGTSLYLVGRGGDAVLVYDRDPATGELSFLESHIDGVAGVTGLEAPRALAVSRDGANVYAVADGSIAVFDRNPATGALTFVEAMLELGTGGVGLSWAWDVSVSPDDRAVLTAGWNALSVYARDPTTGLLTLEETSFGGDADIPDFGFPDDLLIGPENADVYLGCDGAIQVFSWRLQCDDFETGDTSAWSSTVP